MRKSNIGIDLDGVVCDLYPSVYPILQKMHGIDISKTPIEKLQGKWEKEFNLSQEDIQKVFIEACNEGIYRTAAVYEETRKHLVNISRHYNIFYVTVRDFHPAIKKDTFYWLDKNKLPYFRVVFTRSKHKIAEKEDFQFFMDDDPEMCNRVAKTRVPTWMFKRPWNKDAELDPLVKLTDSWEEIEKMLVIEK